MMVLLQAAQKVVAADHDLFTKEGDPARVAGQRNLFKFFECGLEQFLGHLHQGEHFHLARIFNGRHEHPLCNFLEVLTVFANHAQLLDVVFEPIKIFVFRRFFSEKPTGYNDHLRSHRF